MKMRRNIEHEEEEGHIRPACNDDTLFTKKKPSQVVLVSLASQEIHRMFFVSQILLEELRGCHAIRCLILGGGGDFRLAGRCAHGRLGV